MIYRTLPPAPTGVATATAAGLHCPPPAAGGRLLLQGGLVVDPKNGVEEPRDLALLGGVVHSCQPHIPTEPGDTVIDCRGLYVFPGLIDMHLHLGDLFEVSTDPFAHAAADGVTVAFSPGAGNTLLAPSLLGAEFDRGLPISAGVYAGAPALLATSLDDEELVSYFTGTLAREVALQKLSRNPIGVATGMQIIGVKDHMGHFILSDESAERIFSVTSRAGLLFMTHTQDPEHACRMAALSKGRPLYLGHASAAGCGTFGDGAADMKQVLDLLAQPNIDGELLASMMRQNRGCREGLRIDSRAQQLCYQALADGRVQVLASDGQGDATMKGFGDSRDNIPALFELCDLGVLPLSKAVALMTKIPAHILSARTGNPWFEQQLGHLGCGAAANVTVADRHTGRAIYTIVNGQLAAFESRPLRSGWGAGRLVCRFGSLSRTGVGDCSMGTVLP